MRTVELTLVVVLALLILFIMDASGGWIFGCIMLYTIAYMVLLDIE